MRIAAVAIGALFLCFAPSLYAETLGDVLAAHKLSPSILPANEVGRPITSFAVSSDNSPFLLAYYDDDGSGILPSLLHVIRYDERTNSLRQTDLHGTNVPFHGFDEVMTRISNNCMGSALAISERDGFVTIDTHINPSAGCVLILTSHLTFSAGLPGWTLARVNGDILFEENMIHFASTHPARLSLYLPRQRQLIPIYPAKADAARLRFSSELEKHMPSPQWCSQQNTPCDPEQFTSDIENVVVHEGESSFAFDVRMDAEGFGEEAQQSVPPISLHYVCRRKKGTWILSEE